MSDTLQLLQRLGDDPLVETYQARWSGAEQLVRARRLKRRLAGRRPFLERLQEASPRFTGVAGTGLLSHLAWLPEEQPPCWLEQSGPETTLELVLKRLGSREVRISAPAGLLLGERLGEACGLLHARGLVLGLLAPGEVLLDAQGQPWLAGLGFSWALASSKQARALLDRTRRQFLAPEVAQGRTPEPTADVWSLAALTYLLLTGHLPLEDSSGAVSTRNRQVTPPSRLNRTLPYGADAVFLHALAPAPPRRTADATALAQALRRLRASLPGAGGEESELVHFLANLLPNEVRVASARHPSQPQGKPRHSVRPDESPGEIAAAAEQEAPTQVTSPPQAPATASAGPDTAHRDTTPDGGVQLPTSPPLRSTGTSPAATAAATAEGWQPVESESEAEPGPATRQLAVPCWSEPEEDTDSEIAPPGPAPGAEPPPPTDTDKLAAPPTRHPAGAKRLLLPAGVAALVAVLVLLVWALWPAATEPGPKAAAAGTPGQATAIGFLSVTSGRPVQVTLDGELLPAGRPVKHLPLPAGPHRVQVRDTSGRELFDERLEIEPGQHQVLNLVVTPAPASVKAVPATKKRSARRRRPSRRRSRRR